jgi:hypothetical protein
MLRLVCLPLFLAFGLGAGVAVGASEVAIETTQPASAASDEHLTVYKCERKGKIALQERPCDADAKATELSVRKKFTPPIPAPVVPQVQVVRETRVVQAVPTAPALPCKHTAWRCTAATGEVAYRHDGCPRFASGQTSTTYVTQLIPYTDPRTGRVSFIRQQLPSSRSSTVAVEAMRICRAEMCSALADRERQRYQGRLLKDQVFDTYDRNMGRDPCRP